ncbi:MAG: hypothetical protein HS115_17140 [Spirochaetales bacterium]|nr:hypothetical protein [Spirochaetales bacterium]
MAKERAAALLRLLSWQLRRQLSLFHRGLLDEAVDYTEQVEKTRRALEEIQTPLDQELLSRALALQEEILVILTEESSLLEKEHIRLQLDRQMRAFLAGQKISAEQA